MRIALAGDHAGFSLKEEIKALLEGQGHETEDFGADSEEAVERFRREARSDRGGHVPRLRLRTSPHADRH